MADRLRFIREAFGLSLDQRFTCALPQRTHRFSKAYDNDRYKKRVGLAGSIIHKGDTVDVTTRERSMALITNILFPVDFSISCRGMAAYVKRAASLLGAKVSLLHVVDPASYNGLELYERSPFEIAEEHLAVGREKLDSFLTSDFPREDCPRLQASGDAASQIGKVARDGRFDLIVMPTHAGVFRRMLLGSTTAKVLSDAYCPVLTSRHAEIIAPRPLNHREWLCAIGLSGDSERVLRYSSAAAKEAHGNLAIIHAIQAGDRTTPTQLDLQERIQSAEREEASRRIAELQQGLGLDVPVRIAVGSVKSALLEAARQSDADALVIGRSNRPGTGGRLRDLAYAVVRDSPFPVLSV
jgi:nucleotide-binding universal stress UspA family protein